MVRIAIDAMGGDHAPKEIVAGAIQAAKEYPENEFQLYGDQESIQAVMTETLPNIRIIHCSEKVMSEDNFALLYIIKIHIYAHICGYDIESLDKSSES